MSDTDLTPRADRTSRRTALADADARALARLRDDESRITGSRRNQVVKARSLAGLPAAAFLCAAPARPTP